MKYIIIVILILVQNGLAINAAPQLLFLQQPDGSQIQCYARGDEWASWHETPEGWSITKSTSEYWVYSVGVDGYKLVPGTEIVGRDQPPVYAIDGSELQKHLNPEPRHSVVHSPAFQLSSTRTDTFHVPLLLVDFPDLQASFPDSAISDMLNLEGYGHPNYPGSGSFRDFYQEISYGQFNPVTDVVPWVTAANNLDYYANGNPDGSMHVLQMIRAAIDSAEANGMDWSQYDNDNDGNVDVVNIIHAGPGAEYGGNPAFIWSHRWYLSVGGYAVQYDGVLIDDYTIQPETYADTDIITAIGVVCHEFGHALGLPDLYDTDGSSDGAGKLALMASGSWGTSGTTPWYPSAMNAWCKTELGWSNPTILDADQTGIEIEQSYSNNAIYQVNHTQDNSEYWLIENRQKVGTDVNMPSPGILIWHIDTEMTNGWRPNNNEPHYGVGLEQADGAYNLENNQGSDGGDPYPGTTDNHFFTNSSTPSTVSYYGLPSMIAIENISMPDSVMTFDLIFGEILMADLEMTNGTGAAYDTGSITISLDNTMPIGTLQFRINSTPGILSVAGAELSGRASADSISIIDNLIELVNPNIPAGSGTILRVDLFANTSVSQSIALYLTDYYAADTSESEVALITNTAYYQIIGIAQVFTVQDSSAAVGGPFQFAVSLNNTVPIKMISMTLSDAPDYLIPADELFTDSNGNNHWDLGEPFTDWNEDGEWTPAIKLSDRLTGWNHSMSITSGGITIQAAAVLASPITVGAGTLFTVNGVVDHNAQPGLVIISMSNVFLMDIFGNTGVPYNYTAGNITITPYVGTDIDQGQPTLYYLSDNYPNPFNPTTTLLYQVPEAAEISFTIYDLRGMVVKQVNRNHSPGHYTFKWNGYNDSGETMASGTYFIRMSTPGYSVTKKLLLLK